MCSQINCPKGFVFSNCIPARYGVKVNPGDEIVFTRFIGGAIIEYTSKVIEKMGVSVLDDLTPRDVFLACHNYYIKRNPRKAKHTSDIFKQAQELVGEERQKQYGNPQENMMDLAEMANLVLKKKLKKKLIASDWALLMAGCKIIREAYGRKKDNRVDICGYLKIEDMCVENE